MNDSERMDKIQEIILDLSKKSKEEIYTMWEKCIDNYEHNRKSIFYHARQMNENFKTIFPNEYKMMNMHYLSSIERTKNLKEW
jgi:glutamate synthase domain-containing protein 3